MKKWLPAVLALVLLAASVPASAEEVPDPADFKSPYSEWDAEFVFNIATPGAVDSANHYLGWKMKQLIEERSKGRIFCNFHEAGSYGPDREMLEGMQNGTVDFFVGVSASYVPYAKSMGVLDLPNAFSSIAVARRAINDPELIAALTPEFEQAGFKLWGFSDSGFRLATSNRPLQKIEDFAGFKMRTIETPNHLAYWSSLGASPTPMDFSEVYIGLQQGIIDGQENPYDLIVGNKFYETQKYVTETNHLLHNMSIMGSKASFDKLPADLQEIVAQSVRDAHAYGMEVADTRIESRKKIIRDNGCTIDVMPDQLRNDILARIGPVEERIREEAGSELVDLFKSIIAKYEKTITEGK